MEKENEILWTAFAPFFIYIIALAFALGGYYRISNYTKIMPFIIIFCSIWAFYFLNKYDKACEVKRSGR